MELFAADGHDAGGCERVTGKSGMRPSLAQKNTVRQKSSNESVYAHFIEKGSGTAGTVVSSSTLGAQFLIQSGPFLTS